MKNPFFSPKVGVLTDLKTVCEDQVPEARATVTLALPSSFRKASGGGFFSVRQLALALSTFLLISCQAPEEEAALTEYPKWQTVTLSFQGPETSETAADNPFLNYRLRVDFKHADAQYSVRGFYAADGDAANIGADRGNVWQVRFTPDRAGEWEYAAQLQRGDSIALAEESDAGEAIAIENATGKFRVGAADSTSHRHAGQGFAARGPLFASNGYFRFGNGDYWLKGGANSPENLLAHEDFDDTYRMEGANKKEDTPAP